MRGTVRIGKHVETVHEHTTGARDRATAEVYAQKLQAEISHKLLFKRGGDPTKAGRIQHAAVGNGSVVYFLRAGDLIKIGVSTDVKRRRELIQNAHGAQVELVAAIQGDRTHEGMLHAVMTPYRVQGEWYRLPAELERSIADLGKWRGRKKGWQILGNDFSTMVGVKSETPTATNG